MSGKPVSTLATSESRISCYPNPASASGGIQLSGYEGFSRLQLIDISGKILEDVLLESDLMQLNLSRYSKGTYLLMFTDDNGATTVKKLVVN